MINAEEFAKQMKELENKYGTDREALHSKMDELMCKVLTEQGFGEGIKIFEDSDIWYC